MAPLYGNSHGLYRIDRSYTTEQSVTVIIFKGISLEELMNQVLVRRLARVGLVVGMSASLFASCGGGSSSSATTVKRVKNGALTTTTVEGDGTGVTDTTLPGSTDSTQAPSDSVATTQAPAAGNQTVLTSSAGASGDSFGGAVVVSADGSTLAVGALNSNGDQGSVTVFGRSGGKWVQQEVLTDANGGAKDWFGYSMAISRDGNTLAIGAVYADVSGKADQGNVLVFARSGGAWTLQKTLVGEAGAAGDVFGVAVAISDDGNTLAIGAAGDDVGSVADKGSATVFVRKGNDWSLQSVLTDDNGAAKANFGSSVSLSSDGNTLAVGGPNAGKGSVVVFSRTNGAWS